MTIAAVWLVCALLAGLLAGIVWAGWRHAPCDRLYMLVLSASMAVVASWRFIEAVSR